MPAEGAPPALTDEQTDVVRRMVRQYRWFLDQAHRFDRARVAREMAVVAEVEDLLLAD